MTKKQCEKKHKKIFDEVSKFVKSGGSMNDARKYGAKLMVKYFGKIGCVCGKES